MIKVYIYFVLSIYFVELSSVIPKITLVYIDLRIFDCTLCLL